MKCAKCGSELPFGATSCPRCGESIGGPAPSPTKKRMAYGIIALAVVALIALGIALAMRGKSVTQAANTGAAPAKAPTAAPAPMLPPGQAPTSAPVPVPPQPAAKQAPPQEVLDYLDFIKGIEQRRQALLNDQAKGLEMAAGGAQADTLDALISMSMDADSDKPADPLKSVKDELARQQDNWLALMRDFQAKPTPQSCATFGGAYRGALDTETREIARVTTIMNGIDMTSRDSMSNALGQLQSMRKDPQTQGSIDRAVEAADSYLTQLCNAYGIAKPFDIPKEKAGGSLIGL